MRWGFVVCVESCFVAAVGGVNCLLLSFFFPPLAVCQRGLLPARIHSHRAPPCRGKRRLLFVKPARRRTSTRMARRRTAAESQHKLCKSCTRATFPTRAVCGKCRCVPPSACFPIFSPHLHGHFSISPTFTGNFHRFPNCFA